MVQAYSAGAQQPQAGTVGAQRQRAVVGKEAEALQAGQARQRGRRAALHRVVDHQKQGCEARQALQCRLQAVRILGLRDII